MSSYDRRKVEQAIAEYDRYIAKENRRAADLRPVEVQKRLEQYIAKRAVLASVLEGVR